MIRESVRALLIRDLSAMIREIEAYPTTARSGLSLRVSRIRRGRWRFVGAMLGGTGYVRDRPAARLQARSLALAAQKRSFVLPPPD